MTSSCRRKSSKEQGGGGKKIPFTFGKVGEEEEKEEQRREAKKTGVMEKEGQRGRTYQRRPGDRTDSAGKGLCHPAWLPQARPAGGAANPIFAGKDTEKPVNAPAHVRGVHNRTNIQSPVDLTSGSLLSPREGKPVFHFD